MHGIGQTYSSCTPNDKVYRKGFTKQWNRFKLRVSSWLLLESIDCEENYYIALLSFFSPSLSQAESVQVK